MYHKVFGCFSNFVFSSSVRKIAVTMASALASALPNVKIFG